MKIKAFKVKCLMVDKKVTTLELANLAGVSRNTVSCVLSGKSCSFSTAGKLAKALNIPLEEIAEE